MHYLYLKVLQVGGLALLSHHANNLLAYALTLLAATTTRDSYYLVTLCSLAAALLPYFHLIIQPQLQYALPFLAILIISLLLRNPAYRKQCRLEWLLGLFLMGFSIVTLHHNSVVSVALLIGLYLQLILLQLNSVKTLLAGVRIIRIALVVGGVASAVVFMRRKEQDSTTSTQYQQWWYCLSVPVTISLSAILIEQHYYGNNKLEDSSVKSYHAQQGIQMQQLSNRSVQEQDQKQASPVRPTPIKILQESIEDSPQSRKLQSEEPISPVRPIMMTQSSQRLAQSGHEWLQSEALNLLLVIPFCLFGSGYFELPIYAYILSLLWTRNPLHKWIHLLLLVAACSITLQAKCEGFVCGVGLRWLGVWLVSKSVFGEWELGALVRMIWLRCSFVLVLLLLFWFALLTVNLTHLIVIVLILVFITQPSPDQESSSARQHWGWLLCVLNVFMVVRWLYQTIGGLGAKWLMQILGVSFHYLSQWLPQDHDLFNVVPLIINAAVGLQHLTYLSKIYLQETRSPVLRPYQAILSTLVDVLTILYYKAIPWGCYLILLPLLLLLQFSITTILPLTCLLVIFTLQLLSVSSSSTFSRLRILWLLYARLISLLVILRYLFQFTKFDVFAFLNQLPFYQFLTQYEEIIGLAIRDQEVVYFKAISKFQLLVSLDLAAIFVSFLVTQYYWILVKHAQLPDTSQRSSQQRQISLTYERYIDFQLTNWLQGSLVYSLISWACRSYYELFFAVVGLIACMNYSLLMGLYLLICLQYYLSLNLQYYHLLVQEKWHQKIVGMVSSWKHNEPIPIRDTQEKLEKARMEIQKHKIKEHSRLRKWLVLLTCLSVLLTYCSRVLLTEEAKEWWSRESLLVWRWWLWVAGCNHQMGSEAHYSWIIVFLLVLEMKCSWFINKFTLVSKLNSQKQEQEVVREILSVQGPLLGQQIRSSGSSAQEAIEVFEEKEGESERYSSLRYTRKDIVQMRISLLLGIVKLLQRSFVMVLAFISIVQGSHPFGIVYLLCAIMLNSLGQLSMKALSRVLSTLILLQYLLILCNFTNSKLFYWLPEDFTTYQSETRLGAWLGLPEQWQDYLTFGKSQRECWMVGVTWVLLACYQFYFVVMRWSWVRMMGWLERGLTVGVLGRRMLDHLRGVYEYGLTYSPLVVMILCLAIYLLDYTITNLILTALTITFLFISFLLREYRQSRHFWRTYFVVLQLMILCFMILYALLQIPMLKFLCHPLLCAPQQLHTQVYKAVLLMILQIGLDLTNSHHFDKALQKHQHSQKRIALHRLAIAYRHNDKKILSRFKSLRKEQQHIQMVEKVQRFLDSYRTNNDLQFGDDGGSLDSKDSWLDVLLDFLPSLIDEYLLLGEDEARRVVTEENSRWIRWKALEEEDLAQIGDTYFDQLGDYEGEVLEREIKSVLEGITELETMGGRQSRSTGKLQQGQQAGVEEPRSVPAIERSASKFISVLEPSGGFAVRSGRLSLHEDDLPPASEELREQMRASRAGESVAKKQLLYLLLVESVLSNWHYITYVMLLLLHIRNLGLLTFPLPLVVFGVGLISSYQAGKTVWRWLLALVALPLVFKCALGVGIIHLSPQITYLLIGDNTNSVLLQYICIIFIMGQCVILKMIGQYDETTQEIECMKISLIRNLINHDDQAQRQLLYTLLRKSQKIPTSSVEYVFGVSQGKVGYDYSTLLTTLQLCVLVWVFLCYDQMAVRQEATFYRMIQYNQFSSGMVTLTLLQLLFLLGQRFINVADLREWSADYDAALLLKCLLLVLNLFMVEGVVLLFFPLHSEQYSYSGYITVLLILCLMALLVQALQIKKGLDQASRGFMDRYTWYNGFVYLTYRAVPFLFEFKAFSDWTFTRTALRIYDWIRLEEIFGRLYVAKCTALFLQVKVLGDKIEWWKKLLMGYPLLLSIILLLFGPLILFSSLNPLASLNDLTAGYLQITLRINSSNEYPLYRNSHINDIRRLSPSVDEKKLLQTNDIDPTTVQLLELQSFSDQYWQISEGSYQKLLAQPLTSQYELTVRARFDRQQTGNTPLYILNTYPVPGDRVQNLKSALSGDQPFCVQQLLSAFLRLDNNGGLHELSGKDEGICMRAQTGTRVQKEYWVVEGGIQLRVASDKYTQAIFGYSVMSFYISIILVIANYFRFLFQGAVHTIFTTDIPYPEPVLALCHEIYKARRNKDLLREETVFWRIIDLLRSPDTLRALTGHYLTARLKTLPQHQTSKMQ